jgi:hypothetical protein
MRIWCLAVLLMFLLLLRTGRPRGTRVVGRSGETSLALKAAPPSLSAATLSPGDAYRRGGATRWAVIRGRSRAIFPVQGTASANAAAKQLRYGLFEIVTR